VKNMCPAQSQALREKGRVKDMDEGKKKVWICLLIAVLAAVVIGILYYLSAPSQQSSEGFLILAPEVIEYAG